MKQRVAVRQHRVPFLSDQRIEDEAQLLLDEWALSHPPLTEPPVPIESILELHLGLDFEIADLCSELGHPDVLGGIWFGNRLVKVDHALDPSAAPTMLGRYRFTVAHEVGHWRLHRQHLMEDPSAKSLFEADCEPAFVCRARGGPREEVQANRFAASVLMPRKLVFEAWSTWRDSDEPVVIAKLLDDQRGLRDAEEEIVLDQFCRPLADRFEVSAQAMRYRLQSLNLLLKEAVPRLF